MAGRIDRLTIHNFKSYKSTHVVGPFDEHFTSVIGPNGSGKSNLMDAISFVVGVRSSHLRSGQVSELVTTGEKNAYVSLAFVQPNGNEIVFRRDIKNAQATYSIDGKTVTSAAYLDRLASFGVLTKTRNFLVFQGDVEQVASRGPHELVQLFEHISGADALVPRYDELEAECTSLEAVTQYAFGKRKGVMLEKKQKKEQAEEADKFNSLKEELAEQRAELALVQLLYHKSELAGVRQALGVAQASCADVHASTIAPLQKERDDQTAKRKKVQTSTASAEKRLKAVAAEVAKLRPAKLQAKEQMARLDKSTKKNAEALKKREEELAAHKEDVAKLETDLGKIQEALKELDASASSGDRDALKLQEQHVAEYQRLKQVAGSRTFRLKQEIDTLKRSLQAADAEKARVEQQAVDLDEQATHLRQRKEKQAKASEALASQKAEFRASMDRMRAEKQELAQRAEKESKRRKTLESKCEELEERYRDARADMKLSEAEQQQRRALDSLRRLHPTTIYGRMTDCISVTQKKYHMPVTVVMGRNMDAILVEDEATAKSCITHLREQKMAPMTFLPVTTIQAKQIDARLRSLGGTARLMMDVVTPNAAAVAAHPSAVDLKAKFERAARYAVGNTVVCDTLDEARRLCFGGGASAASAGSAAAASAPPPGPRIKAVDLEGTKIDKSGVMTGGTMHSLANRAGRWSEAQFEAVRKERTEAERELRSLPTAEQQKAAQDDLARRAASIQQQLGYAEKDLAEATKTLETLEREAATLEEEKKRTAAQTEKHAAEYAKVASEVSGKETKLRAELDDVFGDFSRRVGVANIAEFEEKHFSQVQQVAAQRSKLTKQVAALQTQIEYERKRGLAKKMEDQRAKLQADQKEADKLREKVEKVEKTEQKHEAEQNELSEKLLALGKETAALDAEIAETKKQLAAEQAKLAGINRSITNMQTRGEEIAMKVRDVLENCEMESVELPAAESEGGGAGASGGAGTKRAAKRARRGAAAAAGDAEMADGDEQAAAEGTFEGEAANNALTELEHFEYTGLSGDVAEMCASRRAEVSKATSSEAEQAFSARLEEMQKDVSDRVSALGRLAPNLKAHEQYESLKKQESAMATEADETKKKLKALQEEFSGVREERSNRILDAFNAVSGKIDAIYKALTKSAAHPLGGTAYLTLEDDGSGSDEPHKGGCKYTAMPPTKRFRDMDQLSGGERTVAALALLFAIHAYQPSPFFVLDEVDAALDGENVTRVAKYIRSQSSAKDASAFQSIVISLKDAFYENANSLVGVTRDNERRTSRCYTFNLDGVEPTAAGAGAAGA